MGNISLNKKYYYSSDYDEFGHMLNVAKIEAKLLESGLFKGVIDIVSTSHVIVNNFKINRKMLQIGSANPGYITFTIWDPKVFFNWRKHEMKDGMIGVLWNNEHRSVTGTEFNAMPISIEENFFINLCRIKGYPELIHHLKKNEILYVSKESLNKIRKLVRFVTGINNLQDSVIHELIEDNLVNQLINCLSSILPEKPTKDMIYPKFVKVIDYIHENLTEITSVRQVSENTKISERTIRRMILNRYGLTTKDYLNKLRLNEVRKGLKNNSKNSNVFQIASEYNFWHMGQFSRDYKRLFGELPSGTLKGCV